MCVVDSRRLLAVLGWDGEGEKEEEKEREEKEEEREEKEEEKKLILFVEEHLHSLQLNPGVC